MKLDLKEGKQRNLILCFAEFYLKQLCQSGVESAVELEHIRDIDHLHINDRNDICMYVYMYIPDMICVELFSRLCLQYS